MSTMERFTPQGAVGQASLASQHSIQNLCEIVAQKDFFFLPSPQIASLLSAIEPDALEDWIKFQQQSAYQNVLVITVSKH